MAFYQRKPDIIIRNGTVIDGTGKPRYYADIAIIGDKIDYIGNLKGVSAPLEIDATDSQTEVLFLWITINGLKKVMTSLKKVFLQKLQNLGNLSWNLEEVLKTLFFLVIIL